nr:hypothetical protein Iba_scaffold948480CG0010 [Ipomoea batatas]GMD04499.1 hypothetical protein Iba_scaffold39118CG0010 [Ipomoea batatas]GME01382.1 hypothetical protein Iba_scaffold538727CG0010 [Ipomoea batatas]
MKGFETKICERRGVGEALEDGIEIAGVAEVSEPYRRTGFAFVAEETRLPSHLQNDHQRRDSAAAASLDGAPRRGRCSPHQQSLIGYPPLPIQHKPYTYKLLFLFQPQIQRFNCALVLAGNRHPPPPIRVIHCRRRHQLAEGDEDTIGAVTSCSPPPECLAIAAWFVVRQPTKREETGREPLEQN